MEPSHRMKVVEKRAWANPEEVQKCLDRFKEYSESKKVKSIVLVAELEGGGLYSGSSRNEDKFKLASALMMVAMEMLGFEQRDRDHGNY